MEVSSSSWTLLGALPIITTAKLHTYPEMITEIYTAASTIRKGGIQVILHQVPSHVYLKCNDQADKLAKRPRA